MQALNYVSDAAIDGGLDYIQANVTVLHLIASSLGGVPNALVEVQNNTLANKTGLTLTGPANGDPTGRSVTIPSISDGTITTGTTASAGYFALLNTAEDELICAGKLSSQKDLPSGNTFTSNSFTIRVPDPTV